MRAIAVGKAAVSMLDAFTSASPAAARETMRIGPADAGHPVPDERSVAAAKAALDLAAQAAPDDTLVLLLSGGASSLMALPAAGVTLADKQQTVRLLLASGAGIAELNTVRKHLSAIKGGRLGAAHAGWTLTLAVSDVVGDDLALIGSGPAVADPGTWLDALAVIDRYGGRTAFPRAVSSLIEGGARGEHPDTPKPDDPRLTRTTARVVGNAADAVRGARQAAESLGYHAREMSEPVIGEARDAAPAHLARALSYSREMRRPCCVLSWGETTVHVTGPGRGGRNQEFILAIAERLSTLPGVVAASVGTDGVDGPTDAAGAVADGTTLARAAAKGLPPPADVLKANNAYAYFHALGDLITTGPTGTNVGDLQIVLVGK